MIRFFCLIPPLLLCAYCFCQEDNPTNRQLAEKQILELRKSVLVVKLKSNDKSIKAYRDAGQKKLADKLEEGLKEVNLYLMRAFLKELDFCDVLFIHSKDAKRAVNGERNIFLNGKMEVDSAIAPPKGDFFFLEYGTVLSNERISEYNYDVKRTQPSSNPATTSALVISDTSFTQLKEPFPFYSVIILVPNPNTFAPQTPETPAIESSAGVTRTIKQHDESRQTLYDKAAHRLNNKLHSFFQRVAFRLNQPTAGVKSSEQIMQDDKQRKTNIALVEEGLKNLYGNRKTFKAK